MKIEEAIQWFEAELIGGKCREDCPQCNANEWALKALRAQQESGWISVEDKLPKREESVLLLFETGIVTGGFICDSDTWCSHSDGEYYTDCSNNPTHWMPLPEPPKEVEHESD